MDPEDRQALDDVLAGVDSTQLLAAAPDAFMIVDGEGRIRALNGLGADMFGYDPDDLVGEPIEVLVPEAVRAAHERHRNAYAERPHTRAMGTGLTLTARRSDRTTFPVEVSLSPLCHEGGSFVIAAIRDVSEQTRIRQQLQSANREAALAEDRERVARDLHDTVIQEVFAVGLSLQSAAARVEDPLAATRLNQAIDDLDRVIRNIRTVIFGLTSHRDWGRGVKGEILRIAASERSALGFEPTLVFEGDVDGLPREIVSEMLAVLKETLSNVARHAEARRCDVIVSVDDRELAVTIVDDGVGPGARPDRDPGGPGSLEFDGDEAGPRTGHGLPNLAMRAERHGGTFDFGPAEIAGSRTLWRVPLPPTGSSER